MTRLQVESEDAVGGSLGTAHDTPAQTVVGTGRWLVGLWVDRNQTAFATWTVPADMTERYDQHNTISAYMATTLADSGAPVAAGTYTKTATSSQTAQQYIAFLLVLKPQLTNSFTVDLTDSITGADVAGATSRKTRAMLDSGTVTGDVTRVGARTTNSVVDTAPVSDTILRPTRLFNRKPIRGSYSVRHSVTSC